MKDQVKYPLPERTQHEEGTDMNVGKLSGAGAAQQATAAGRRRAERPPQETASPARRQDRLELHFAQMREAEENGYLEVNGYRFTVTEEMSRDTRRAYEQFRAQSEGAAARLDAAQNARLDRQRTESARLKGHSMQQAQKIARRISSGEKVPSEDEHYLMTFSKEMYQAAKLQAAAAEEREACESVFEDGELLRADARRLAEKLQREIDEDLPPDAAAIKDAT